MARTIATVTVALSFGLLLAAHDARARPPLALGLQDDPVFVGHGHGALRAAAYRAARRLRVTVIRVNVVWASVERSPERYSWARYDAAVNAARANRMAVQLTLTGPAPAWDTGDGRAGPYEPNASAFGRFTAAAASHFRGRAARYSIWNEPNWPSWLEPHARAADLYRALYLSAYAAVKAADPAVPVLIGELAPMGEPEPATPPLRFIRELTCRDGRLRATRRCPPLYADGFAIHPYTLRWPPWFPGAQADDVTIGSLDRLTRTLDVLARWHALETPRGRPPALYLTEYGYHARLAAIPESIRAAYTIAAYGLAMANPRVREIVWYQLVAPRRFVRGTWDTALLSPSGAPRRTFLALAHWARGQRRIARTARW